MTTLLQLLLWPLTLLLRAPGLVLLPVGFLVIGYFRFAPPRARPLLVPAILAWGLLAVVLLATAVTGHRGGLDPDTPTFRMLGAVVYATTALAAFGWWSARARRAHRS